VSSGACEYDGARAAKSLTSEAKRRSRPVGEVRNWEAAAMWMSTARVESYHGETVAKK
jgi:hypothetical protein